MLRNRSEQDWLRRRIFNLIVINESVSSRLNVIVVMFEDLLPLHKTQACMNAL